MARALHLAALLALGCGGSTTLLCPEGTRDTNGVCCPPGYIGEGAACAPIGGPPLTGRDIPATPDTTTPTSDLPPRTGDDVSPDAPADVAVDPGIPVVLGGSIGTPCDIDEHCPTGGVCLSWENGYCTLLGCATAPDLCPTGSVCAALGGTGACLARCVGGSCDQGPGRFCKSVEAASGETLNLCHGTESGAGGLGAPCATHEACAGQLSCYGGVPGGMCVSVDCSPNSCPPDAVCMPIDGRALCLPSCSGDEGCEGTDRSCVQRKDLRGDPASVCYVPSGNAGIGRPCVGGHECDSEQCLVVATGTCVGQPDLRCKDERDCTAGVACARGPDHRRGVCTAPCSFDRPAACGGDLCIATSDGSALCARSCVPDDSKTCDLTVGMDCLFGIPLGSSQERHVCVRPEHPGPMTGCAENEECGDEGRCLRIGEDPGYCVIPCAADGGCPFPGHCVQSDGGLDTRCYRSCAETDGCPEGFRCALPDGSVRRACIP